MDMTYLDKPCIDIVSLEEKEYIKSKVEKKVLFFISTLEKNNIDLDILFSNLKTINIKESNLLILFNIYYLLKGKKIQGYYDSKANKIVLKKNSTRSLLHHELLHAASSIYKDGNYYSGFYQYNKKKNKYELGFLLNEGYTEVLRQKYFHTRKSTYASAQKIALIIEKIIGEETMTDCYFKADLPTLVNSLSRYIPERQIMDFLSSDDIEFAREFVMYTYFNKLRHDYFSGIINKNDLANSLAYYIHVFKDEKARDEVVELFSNIFINVTKEKTL